MIFREGFGGVLTWFARAAAAGSNNNLISEKDFGDGVKSWRPLMGRRAICCVCWNEMALRHGRIRTRCREFQGF